MRGEKPTHQQEHHAILKWQVEHFNFYKNLTESNVIVDNVKFNDSLWWRNGVAQERSVGGLGEPRSLALSPQAP